MKEPVLTKKDFVRRYSSGEFGNHAPTWDSLEEWQQREECREGEQRFHIRNRVAGGRTYYDLLNWNVLAHWYYFCKWSPSSWYISAMAPTEHTLLQGEVQRGIWGYDLLYTTVRKPMRDALAERCSFVQGIIASCLLSMYLCPKSLEWLEYLLDEYPNHVVEFSTYDREWGTVPGFNTVYWELRQY